MFEERIASLRTQKTSAVKIAINIVIILFQKGPQKQLKTHEEKIKSNAASRECRIRKKFEFELTKVRLEELQLEYRRLQQVCKRMSKIAKRQQQENWQLRQQLTMKNQ